MNFQQFDEISVLQRADEAQLGHSQLHTPAGRSDLPDAALLLVRRIGVGIGLNKMAPVDRGPVHPFCD